MRFRGTIEAARGGGAMIPLPFDAKEAFGKARAPVRGTVAGEPFRSTVAVYGGVSYLGVPKALRAAAGADVGDEVDVEVELDDTPREVEVPAPLVEALAADEAAAAAFGRLSYTHRREYARWIDEAKRDETRARRVSQAVEMLRAGVKTPD